MLPEHLTTLTTDSLSSIGAFIPTSSSIHTNKVIITKERENYKKDKQTQNSKLICKRNIITNTLYQIQCTPNNHIDINLIIKDSSKLNYSNTCIDIRFTWDMHLWWPLLLCRASANEFHPTTHKVNPFLVLGKGKTHTHTNTHTHTCTRQHSKSSKPSLCPMRTPPQLPDFKFRKRCPTTLCGAQWQPTQRALSGWRPMVLVSSDYYTKT